MGNEYMFYAIATLVVAIIIFMIYYRSMNASNGTSETIAGMQDISASDIVAQFNINRKNNGNIFAFRKAIGDDNFSPYHYAQLATLYKEGKLTTESAARIIAMKN